MQDCSNSIVDALALLQSCSKLLKYECDVRYFETVLIIGENNWTEKIGLLTPSQRGNLEVGANTVRAVL